MEVKIKIWGARYLQNGISYSQMDCGKVKLGADISRIVKKFVPRTTVAIVVQSGVKVWMVWSSCSCSYQGTGYSSGYRLFPVLELDPGPCPAGQFSVQIVV